MAYATQIKNMSSAIEVGRMIKENIFYKMLLQIQEAASQFCVPFKIAVQNKEEHHKTKHGFVHHTKFKEYKAAVKNGNALIEYFMDTNDRFLYNAILYSMWNLEFQYESWHKN